MTKSPASNTGRHLSSTPDGWWARREQSEGATCHSCFTSHPSCVTHSVVRYSTLSVVTAWYLTNKLKNPMPSSPVPACLSSSITEGNAGADMVFLSQDWSREVAVCTPCPLGIHPARDALPWSLLASHSIFSYDTFRLRGCLLEQCFLNLFHLKPLHLKVFYAILSG